MMDTGWMIGAAAGAAADLDSVRTEAVKATKIVTRRLEKS